MVEEEIRKARYYGANTTYLAEDCLPIIVVPPYKYRGHAMAKTSLPTLLVAAMLATVMIFIATMDATQATMKTPPVTKPWRPWRGGVIGGVLAPNPPLNRPVAPLGLQQPPPSGNRWLELHTPR